MNKQLRNGLTTGTCVAAVAKASVWMLVNRQVVNHVSVVLPDTLEVILDIENISFSNNEVKCLTVKDAGDDPDVTNGIKIYATAKYNSSNQINIIAGKGIGQVTKPGLAVEVGQPAINPVPMRMIKQAISEVRPENVGVDVILDIPEGVEIAKRTFNQQLGIVGGISVLGTTGIVKPMSEEALKASLELHLNQLKALGYEKVIFVPGNYASTFLKARFSFDEQILVQTSNFIGFMLEKAVELGFKEILLVGHIGKLVKLAGGIFQTHSRVADCRNEILASHYLNYSSDIISSQKLFSVNTTEEAVEIIGKSKFWNILSNSISERATKYVYNDCKIETIIFSQNNGMLGKSNGADNQLLSFGIKAIENSDIETFALQKNPKISICGIGPGSYDCVLPIVFQKIAFADLVIAGKRHLQLAENCEAEKKVFSGKLTELKELLVLNNEKNIVVLVSGDTGFYSLRKFITENFQNTDIECVPGISSYQFMFSRLNMGYEDVVLASLHGKEFDYISQLQQGRKVFLLTDNVNKCSAIAQRLINCNLSDAIMYIGSNLSYGNELIVKTNALDAISCKYDAGLCSVILVSD
jgi:cobalt-precorrin-5B (C1)-methyltransferase